MSKITVTTIAGATSGSDANTVKIESGDTLAVQSNATIGGTLGITGTTTTGNITTGNTSIVTAGRFISSQTSNDPWFKGVNSSNSETLFIKKDGQIYSAFGLSVGGTGAANTLDDFEEGTWTPTFVASGCTFTHSIQKGYYTKIGRLVIYHCYLQLDGSLSTNGNAVIIDGLPFTSDPTHGNISTSVAGIRYVNLSSNYYTVEGRINNNNNYITLYESGDNQATAILPANRLSNSSGQIQLSGHYITTA